MASQGQLSDYCGHGALTDPGEHLALLAGLPADAVALCKVVQGLLIHDYFGSRLYDSPPENHYFASRRTLPIARRLDAIAAFRNEAVFSPRPPFERMVGTCRDYALMICAILRQHAVPARVRCGFAGYFSPPSFEDHWICEYWKQENRRWAIADAQLDEAHREHLGIDFDIADVPSEQFVFPWQAWQRWRAGTCDPALFGSGSVRGEWFLQVNLARDLLSLCKHEVSAWDTWRDARAQDRRLDDRAIGWCDRIAALAEAAEGLVPPDWTDDGILKLLSRPPWQSQSASSYTNEQ